MSFSDRLKQAMDDKNINQSDLSELTGMSKSSISQYLSGKNEPRRDGIKKISEALQVSESWLLGQSEVSEQPQQPVKKLTVEEAARIMGKSEKFVRFGLQQGLFPFGTAVKTSSKWSYYISPQKFNEYVGR